MPSRSSSATDLPESGDTLTTKTDIESESAAGAGAPPALRIRTDMDGVVDEAIRHAGESSATAPVFEYADEEVVFDLRQLSCYYGSFRAVRDISFKVPRN